MWLATHCCQSDRSPQDGRSSLFPHLVLRRRARLTGTQSCVPARRRVDAGGWEPKPADGFEDRWPSVHNRPLALAAVQSCATQFHRPAPLFASVRRLGCLTSMPLEVRIPLPSPFPPAHALDDGMIDSTWSQLNNAPPDFPNMIAVGAHNKCGNDLRRPALRARSNGGVWLQVRQQLPKQRSQGLTLFIA